MSRVWFRQGMAWLGRHVKARSVVSRLCAVGLGEARHRMAGLARLVLVKLGTVRHRFQSHIYEGKLSMIYKWKAGSRIKIDPQVAGAVCDELEKKGKLTPSELVEVSRDEAAPLHKAFEWNDEEAARRYRETQAGYIIRSLEIVLVDKGEPVRAFFPITINSTSKGYTSIETIISDYDAKQALLESALAELSSFKRKYKRLSELDSVFAAIDTLFDLEEKGAA